MVGTCVSEPYALLQKLNRFIFIYVTADAGFIAYRQAHDRRVEPCLRTDLIVTERLFLILFDPHAVLIAKTRLYTCRRKSLICGPFKVFEGFHIVLLCFGSAFPVVESDPVHRFHDALIRRFFYELKPSLLVLFTAESHLEHHAHIIGAEREIILMRRHEELIGFFVVLLAADPVSDRLSENIAAHTLIDLLGLLKILQRQLRISVDTISARILLAHADHGDRMFLGSGTREPHGRFLRIAVHIGPGIKHLCQRQPGVYITAGGRFSVPFICLLEVLIHAGSGLVASSQIKTGKRMPGLCRFPKHLQGLLIDRLLLFLTVKCRGRLRIRVVKQVGVDDVFYLIVKVSFPVFHAYIFSQKVCSVVVSEVYGKRLL